MTNRFWFWVSVAVLSLVLGAPPVSGQSTADTDYVVMFDVSLSMNDPEGNPTLSIVKKALEEMVKDTWLPSSKSQNLPGRLYFYPFAKEVRPRRQFELTTSGTEEFIDYLNRLEADGYATAIIDTLEEVLETVPKVALSDGRKARRQYILLTDGDETERNDWVDEKLLRNLLKQWNQELSVENQNDHLFILRVGSLTRSSERNLKEMEEQAEESGASVEVDRSPPDPEVIRRKLQPPASYGFPTSQDKAVSYVNSGEKNISVSLLGKNLPETKPSGLRMEARFKNDVPKHSRLRSDSSTVSAAQWEELREGKPLVASVPFDFNPPQGVDVDDQGVLIWRLVDSTGKVLAGPFEKVVNVTSRGKAEVRFSTERIEIEAGRIDARESFHEFDFELTRDAAVDQRGGLVTISATPAFPKDDVAIIVDGMPLSGNMDLNLSKGSGLTSDHSLQFRINNQADFTQYSGVIYLESKSCQLKTRSGVANRVEIPWQIKGEPIPAALIEVKGSFPINGKKKLTAERNGKATESIKFRESIGFEPAGEAGKEAKRRGYIVTVTDWEMTYPAGEMPSGYSPRDPLMKVLLDNKEKTITGQPDAVTVDIEMPGDTPPGRYFGKLILEIENAKFSAKGLGAPVGEIELYWEIEILAQKPKMVTLLTPENDQVIRIGKEPDGAETSLPRQTARIDFSEVGQGEEVEVSVSVSPRFFLGKGSVSNLSPSNAIVPVDLILPGLEGAGVKTVELRFDIVKGNAVFQDDTKTQVRSITVEVDPAPIPSASLIMPVLKTGQKLPLNAKWGGGSVTSGFSLELDFNAEAQRKNTEVTVVDESGAVVGKLSSLTSNLSVPVRHQLGELRVNKKFRLSSTDSGFVFSNGKEFLEFEIVSNVDDYPQPEVLMDSSGVSSYLSFDYSEEEQEIEEIVRFTWSESAKWLNSRFNLVPLSDIELNGRPRLTYLEPPLDSIDSSVTEVRIITRIPAGLEPGSYSESYRIIPEGDLDTSESVWILEREGIAKPMTTSEIAKMMGIALAVLLIAGFVGKKMYDKKFGDPVFPGNFYCDVQSEELSALRLKGRGDSSVSFGGDYSEGADYPLNFTLTAVKAASGLGCKIEFSESESESQQINDLLVLRFDQDGDRHDFVSGESVSGGDRLEVLDGSKVIIEISFRGLSVGPISGVEDEEFDGSDFDDFDDFDEN